jgi:GNAT superfamily N-acetyltransferase
MQVRPAVVADAARLAEVHVLSWQVGYRGLLPQPLLDGLHPAQRVPRWTLTIQQAAWPRRGTLVADDAGDVVGFADFRPTQDDGQDPTGVGEVASFYILPAMWGQGIGRHLMATATSTLGAAGFASATLWVLETNTRAIRFYGHAGWEPDGASRNEIVGGTPIRDIRYGLKLSQVPSKPERPTSGNGARSGPRWLARFWRNDSVSARANLAE